jgi:ribosome-binding protein aMBF1 (putative translation factor)
MGASGARRDSFRISASVNYGTHAAAERGNSRAVPGLVTLLLDSALEEEFVLASAVMDVRGRAGLTQKELARRMGTTQPVVARLESGRTRPSMRTLERLAKATGSRLLISFEPRGAKTPTGPHS